MMPSNYGWKPRWPKASKSQSRAPTIKIIGYSVQSLLKRLVHRISLADFPIISRSNLLPGGDAEQLWLETALAKGIEIPVPVSQFPALG
jgi:hypothetical protein